MWSRLLTYVFCPGADWLLCVSSFSTRGVRNHVLPPLLVLTATNPQVTESSPFYSLCRWFIYLQWTNPCIGAREELKSVLRIDIEHQLYLIYWAWCWGYKVGWYSDLPEGTHVLVEHTGILNPCHAMLCDVGKGSTWHSGSSTGGTDPTWEHQGNLHRGVDSWAGVCSLNWRS